MTTTRQHSIPVTAGRLLALLDAGAGHLLNLERAATFNHHVPGFLACLDGPAHALRRTGSDRAAHRRLGSGH